ncbi:MAG: hypothetical protein AAGF67_09775 [Verrucomicrobiota bacterium]
MSENHPEPDHPESDQELESLLKKLQPNPLEFGLRRNLENRCARAHEAPTFAPVPDSTPKWNRLIPLAVMGALGMLAYASFHYGSPFASRSETPAVAESSIEVKPPALVSSLEGGQFQPVSAQGFLVDSSSGGLIETEEGLQERMNLEYNDAYHWHDPKTGTSIRVFQPRSEEVIIPLPTD